MGDSLEGSESTSTETQNVAIVDFTAFTNYILKAASVLLPEDDSQAEPVALKAALDDKANQECIRKFLSDSQVSTLYIQRSSSKGTPGLYGLSHAVMHNDFADVQVDLQALYDWFLYACCVVALQVCSLQPLTCNAQSFSDLTFTLVHIFQKLRTLDFKKTILGTI